MRHSAGNCAAAGRRTPPGPEGSNGKSNRCATQSSRRSGVLLAFVSLYRKYRSQRFDDLVGQSHVVRTLQNALASEKHSHAYLFTGPRGTGKTSTARLLAKALCCEKGPTSEPCNECAICLDIQANACLDVIEIDAASESGVDEVRDMIVEKADYKPAYARFRVYIIDEVHDLSAKAFDALLKTIEEPPPHLVFILATTEYSKVPRTIQSRCQKFEFHRGSVADLIGRLEYVAQQEGIACEPAALQTLARMADGGFRDALTLLEQAALTADGPITNAHVYVQFGWVDDAQSDAILLSICERDTPTLLTTLDSVFGAGRDPRAAVESLLFRLAELTSVLFGASEPGKDASHDAALHETAVRIGPDRMLRLRGEIAGIHRALRDVSLPRLWLESELLRLTLEPAAAGAERPAPQARQPSEPRPAARAEPSRSPRPALAPTESEKPANEPAVAAVNQTKAADATPEEPKAEPSAHPEPEPTGDPELDRARDVWHKTVEELGGLSRSMANRLSSTVVTKLEGKTLHVRFDRAIERDWVMESDKRQHAIRETVAKHAGEPWSLAYDVRPRTNGEASAPAVELPVEGERLVEMAKEVFGG
jgi:DNA polymerase III subunit gamma/tau